MKDRFTRGLLAGLIAWLPTFIVNYATDTLGISKLMFKDFLAVVVYGRLATNIWENVFAYGALMGFLAVLGGIFAFLIKGLGVKNYLLKGIIYGLTLWFTFYAISHLYKMPELETISLGTAIGNFLGSSVWGLSMALTLGWLDKKVESKQW